jgi:hypothetical protein
MVSRMSDLAGLIVQMQSLCARCLRYRSHRWLAQITANRRDGLLLMTCTRCGTPRACVSVATEKWLLGIVQLLGRPTEPIVFAQDFLPVMIDAGTDNVDQELQTNERN